MTARRTTRQGETLVKKMVSEVGYSVINAIAEVPIPRGAGDFRLISRRVIEELRGLEQIAWVPARSSISGRFSQAEVMYERDVRHAGAGNYNRYFGSMKIGLNGIIGFSTFPLQIMMWVGFAIAALSALAIFVVIILKIIQGDEYPIGNPNGDGVDPIHWWRATRRGGGPWRIHRSYLRRSASPATLHC